MKKVFYLFIALMISQNVLAQNSFITTWKTDNAGTSNSSSITIPTTGTGYLYDIDWNNDGIFDEFNLTGNATHDYMAAGTYTVAIKGAFPRIYFNNSGDKSKLLSIQQWGNIVWTSMERAFQGCNNMVLNASDAPNTVAVTDMSFMFAGCSSYNQALPSSFNTTNVTNMLGMFAGCSAYNQALPSSFNTTNVTNMNSMFNSCSSFNQPLPSSFNTANVTDMGGMFNACSAYNQALPSSFNTAVVTNMHALFKDCIAYNQPLPSSFNTANVTNMYGVFYGCTVYNQALPSSFNTANVTSMSFMFSNCIAYNQALPSSFNTANVTNMGYMFQGCTVYNQPLPSSFNTANVTNMSVMFGSCISYNQPFPSSFNTANVTDMLAMFVNCISYNQPFPSSFNTAKVTDMRSMFSGASTFNQNIGHLDITNATGMTGIFNNSGISRTNYDNILTAWNTAGYTNKNLGDASPLTYCAGQAARTTLTTAIASGGKGWTITGDALSCTVLPVELLDFKGTPQYNGNFLTWTTANEVNNKGFYIERASPQPSKGALPTWVPVGFVNAKGKAATYDFTDVAPPSGAGAAYYRLRQIDKDGKETFSKVISIQNFSSEGRGLKVYPSVSTSILTVETSETADYQVFNLLGQQVLNGKTGQQINVSALPQGKYILKVGTEQAKFVKQ